MKMRILRSRWRQWRDSAYTREPRDALRSRKKRCQRGNLCVAHRFVASPFFFYAPLIKYDYVLCCAQNDLPDESDSQAYYTADEESDHVSAPVRCLRPTISNRSSFQTSHSQSLNQEKGKRGRNRRHRRRSVNICTEEHDRDPPQSANRGRGSGRSRIQVDKMQLLQSSIQDGSPYYSTREEVAVAPPPILEEAVIEGDHQRPDSIHQGIYALSITAQDMIS